MTEVISEYDDNQVVIWHTANAPVDVEAICRDLQLPFSYEPMTDAAGALVRDHAAPRGFRVVVNSNDPHRRRRFTMAHEIAHFILHRDLVPDGLTDNAMYRSVLSTEYERQADKYAAAVLLPASTLRREIASGNRQYGTLADKFDVSEQALRIRVKELGLL